MGFTSDQRQGTSLSAQEVLLMPGGGSSCVPNGEVNKSQQQKRMEENLSMCVHPKDLLEVFRIPDHKPDVARIDNFLQISIDTKYYSMEKRIIFLQNVGPLEADGDINPIYIESLRIAASRVKSFEIPY
ncbi:hypothetical protein RUM44_002731 [Polyplax serrata]|uniref:Uncharacterized protein n=1 Tax=Polyplax serrata TaxID=468196 RepID=A0ABR1AFL3_POLSC